MKSNCTGPMQGEPYRDETINYTNYLRDKPLETDPSRLALMEMAVTQALEERGVLGQADLVRYADGRVMVKVGGEYYGMFDANTGKFFSGCPGDPEA